VDIGSGGISLSFVRHSLASSQPSALKTLVLSSRLGITPSVTRHILTAISLLFSSRVVVSDPEALKHILSSNMKNYNKDDVSYEKLRLFFGDCTK